SSHPAPYVSHTLRVKLPGRPRLRTWNPGNPLCVHSSAARRKHSDDALKSHRYNCTHGVGMRKIALVGLVCSTLSVCLRSQPGAETRKVVDDGVVIEDVTLISPERQLPLPHADVVIRNRRIAEIGTNIAAGPHAQRIDGPH